MSPADEIKKFLDTEDGKVRSMKFWIDQEVARGEVTPDYYSDGPYPSMAKLIALCCELLVFTEGCGSVDDKFAHEVISRAAEIVREGK